MVADGVVVEYEHFVHFTLIQISGFYVAVTLICNLLPHHGNKCYILSHYCSYTQKTQYTQKYPGKPFHVPLTQVRVCVFGDVSGHCGGCVKSEFFYA